MQTPITREIAQMPSGRPWKSFPALLRFVSRIVKEGRGNELFFNALREIRYSKASPYNHRDALRVRRNNLSDLSSHLAPRLKALGYCQLLEFSSTEEDKCLVVGDRLICKTSRGLLFYNMERALLRKIDVDGFLTNFVYAAERIYFVVDGSLYSTTLDSEVRNENLSLSSNRSIVLDQGVAADSTGNLVVAEYKQQALGKSAAFVYVRRAGDARWTTISTLANLVDKHCHIVAFDSASQLFYITCGDTRKMVAKLDLSGAQIKLEVISSSAFKTGGYMCAAPWEGGLICGTDYTGGTNFLVLLRNGRIQRKEALRSPFRRCIVSSVASSGEHLLFTMWNMGHLPHSSSGLLLRSPAETRPLCYTDEPGIRFDLFPSKDGLVVRGAAEDHQVFGIFRRW